MGGDGPGLERIRGSLARAVEKGKIEAAARDAALARLTGAVDLAAAGRLAKKSGRGFCDYAKK